MTIASRHPRPPPDDHSRIENDARGLGNLAPRQPTVNAYRSGPRVQPASQPPVPPTALDVSPMEYIKWHVTRASAAVSTLL